MIVGNDQDGDDTVITAHVCIAFSLSLPHAHTVSVFSWKITHGNFA